MLLLWSMVKKLEWSDETRQSCRFHEWMNEYNLTRIQELIFKSASHSNHPFHVWSSESFRFKLGTDDLLRVHLKTHAYLHNGVSLSKFILLPRHRHQTTIRRKLDFFFQNGVYELCWILSFLSHRINIPSSSQHWRWGRHHGDSGHRRAGETHIFIWGLATVFSSPLHLTRAFISTIRGLYVCEQTEVSANLLLHNWCFNPVPPETCDGVN